MKKLFILFFGLISLFAVASCGQSNKLATPTNFQISDNVASWDAVEGAEKYRLHITNDNGVDLKRIVNKGTTQKMETYNLDLGIYQVEVQALAPASSNMEDSDYSAPVQYEVKAPEYPVLASISGADLIDNDYVKWQGRTSYNEELGVNMIYHSASSFEVKFTGTKVTLDLYATKYNDSRYKPYAVIIVDNDYNNRFRFPLTKKNNEVIISDVISVNGQGINNEANGTSTGLKNDGKVHTISVYKSTESTNSHMGLKSISTDGSFIPEIEVKERLIEFIAASSSTGHGNLASSGEQSTANSDCMQAFSYLTARALDADISIYSASGWGVKRSKWTQPDQNLYDAYKYVDFYSTERWDVTTYTPDVIVINLGTNDYSYINDNTTPAEKAKRMEDFINQYVDFLNYLSSAYPNCKIIVFYGLMNEGKEIYDPTDRIVELAQQSNPTIAKIQVSGDGKGINGHPSVASHKQVAEQLIAKIKVEMGW